MSKTATFESAGRNERPDEEDRRVFEGLTSISLSSEDTLKVETPTQTAPGAEELLAVHWHPEWAPLESIARRLDRAFPRAENRLVIPTQHNRIMTFGPWAGVEIDAWAPEYNKKVQLLIHLRAELLPQAGVFTAMVERTYAYRADQLLNILDRLINLDASRAEALCVGSECGSSPEAVSLARRYAVRLKTLILDSGLIGSGADELLKNRLLPDFLAACCRLKYPQTLLEQAILVVSAIKKRVKTALRPDFFYRHREVIEEARSLGAGIVIPHPPQFWPILMEDLDVDGWEVWNPSTPQETLFLIDQLAQVNARRPANRRELLAFMGDDTHMSAKLRENYGQEKAAERREIGFQPLWDDPVTALALARAGQSRTKTLNEYRRRLAG